MLYCFVFFVACFCSSTSVYSKVTLETAEFNEVINNAERLLKTDVKEALTALKQISDKLEFLSSDQKIDYYRLLSEAYVVESQFVLAKETTNKALILAKNLASTTPLMIKLLYIQGFSLENLGDWDAAEEHYKKGLEIAKSFHDKVQIANGLIDLGAIAYLRENYKSSLLLLNDAYKIASQTGDNKLKGKVNSELAIVYANIGQIEQAINYNLQSYQYYKAAGLLLLSHNSLANLGWDYYYDKQYNKAIATFNKILLESSKESPSHIMYAAYSGLAQSYLLSTESDPELSLKYFNKAEEHLKNSQRYDKELMFYIDKSFLLFELKRYEEALVSISIVDELLLEHNFTGKEKYSFYIELINLRSECLYQLNQFKDAYDLKSKLVPLIESWYQDFELKSVDSTRLTLENEQEDLRNKSLKNENIVHEASLVQAKKIDKEQQIYLFSIVLVVLALAWLIVRLVYSQQQLTIVSTIDSLTGISNRRSLMEQALLAFQLAKSNQSQLCLLVLDIDHFKVVNDSLGHKHGDIVLKEVALLTRELMRKSDTFGRLGGEEFMICLPGKSMESGVMLAERIRLCIAQKEWALPEIKKITVSIGVASLDNDADLIDFMQRADKLLYKAKNSGRNKVCS